MKIYDQHVHCYCSFDSNESIKEYLDKTQELGLEYLVLTDHCDFNHINKGIDYFFDVKKRQEELNQLQKEYPNIKILSGIEIGYKPSELTRINKVLSENHFDLINFSLHELEEIDYYYKDSFIEKGIDNILKEYFEKEYESIRDFDNFDVFCHLDYGFKTAYSIDNTISIQKYEDIIIRIMKELIKKEKALEINVKVQKFLPIEHTKYLLNLYKSLGGKYLTLSSDAHKLSVFCLQFDYYTQIIKEAGFNQLTYFINRKKYLCDI